MEKTPKTKNASFFIDITNEVCPLTFVKTKLAIEKLTVGEILEVRLRGQEPLENVPRSAKEHGHTIIENEPESLDQLEYGVHRLTIRKEV